jgi:peptidoglycan/xylan/chitin deacetylase (PgdA/CDA1 family)
MPSTLSVHAVVTAHFALLFAALALGLGQAAWAADGAAPGATRVARWPDDKQGAFMLLFDDSVPSDVKNAIPEMKKRGLTGTFYINPGCGHYQGLKNDWEKTIPAEGMEYGNHTWDHKGAKNAEALDEELAKCNEVIFRLMKGPQPRLVSFGRPGVDKGAWTVTGAQVTEALAKHHLVERPTFNDHGATIAFKNAADYVKQVDQALAKGGLGYVIFHGVGGDWISCPLGDFIALCDKLVAERQRLWIAGTIAVHKYQTERDGATVTVDKADARQIVVTLAVKTDPALYDAPLTLVTQVSAGWARCSVVQGTNPAVEAAAVGGSLRYAVKPVAGAITISPAK